MFPHPNITHCNAYVNTANMKYEIPKYKYLYIIYIIHVYNIPSTVHHLGVPRVSPSLVISGTITKTHWIFFFFFQKEILIIFYFPLKTYIIKFL